MFITDRHKIVLALASCVLLIILLLGPMLPEQGIEASHSAAATLYSVKLPGDRIQYSSPIMADLDGDGPKEIIVGGKDGKLHVVDADGSVRWTASTGKPIQSSPAAGDLDGDGDMEVVVTTGGEPGSTSGGVYAYNRNGTPFWSSPFLTTAGIFSSPALGDLDKDGKMEVAFGCWDNKVYVLNHNGTKRWDYNNQDTVWSSPALADLTGDGNLEVIIGADASGISGGYLYVFDKDKTVLVQKSIDQAIYSSPAIGDIDGDNQLDIVVGTGPWTAFPGGYNVFAWDRNGNPLPGWPVSTAGYMTPSPALADLNGDGTLDVVALCEDPWRVYAWRGNGSQLFATSVTPSIAVPLRYNSPTVADYDGDGTLEVLVAANWSIQAIDASGTQETGVNDYNAKYSIFASPAVGDIDNDGNLEMAIGGSDIADSSSGYLHIWRVGPVATDVSAAQAGLPWPMFHHDAQHTGLIGVPVGQPRLSVDPNSILIMHPYGRASSSSVVIVENTGGGTINWTSSVNPYMPAPVTITLDPPNGAVAETSRSAVTVRVTGLASVPMGSHNLGRITISGTSGGAAVDGSPQTVDLTLQVGDTVWLPPVMR